MVRDRHQQVSRADLGPQGHTVSDQACLLEHSLPTRPYSERLPEPAGQGLVQGLPMQTLRRPCRASVSCSADGLLGRDARIALTIVGGLQNFMIAAKPQINATRSTLHYGLLIAMP